MTIQPQRFSFFDNAINHADSLGYGEPMHGIKEEMIAAFTECHNTGRYVTNKYAIDRVLSGDDYSVSYLVYFF